jgi:hypothetical protein
MILLSTPTSMRQWPHATARSPTRQGPTPVAGHDCGTLLFFFFGGGGMFGWMMLDCGAHRRGMWLRGRTAGDGRARRGGE